MTVDQVMSIARSILQIAGTFLITYGTTIGLDAAKWETISGGILVIVPIVWGMIAHSRTGTIAAAARLDDVHMVIADHELAKQVPSDKVVSSEVTPTRL